MTEAISSSGGEFGSYPRATAHQSKATAANALVLEYADHLLNNALELPSDLRAYLETYEPDFYERKVP